MKIHIKTYEYQKVEKEGTEFELPDETSYFFETGIRRAIRMEPKWSTWMHKEGKKEYITGYKVTCVYRSSENIVETFDIQMHMVEHDFNDRAKGKKPDFVRSLLNGWLDKRTKEDFEQDLQASIKEFNLTE